MGCGVEKGEKREKKKKKKKKNLIFGSRQTLRLGNLK